MPISPLLRGANLGLRWIVVISEKYDINKRLVQWKKVRI